MAQPAKAPANPSTNKDLIIDRIIGKEKFDGSDIRSINASAVPIVTPDEPPLLELLDATVLRGRTRALDGMNLTLRLGEHTAIVGPNGSGKSTLVQLLTGRLYPLARPDGPPPVRVFGRARWNLGELRGRLGVISADAHERLVGGSSLGRVTALDAVLASFFGSEVVFMHHEATPGMRSAALAALDRVGAAHLADKRLNEVSTGEARRVVVARALVHEPDVVVLDEPTTGLDAVARHRLLHRLRRLANAGTTLIIITHHLEEVIPETRRVILLDSGRIAADGTPDEVLTPDRVGRVYGAPVSVVRVNGGFTIAVDPQAQPSTARDGS